MLNMHLSRTRLAVLLLKPEFRAAPKGQMRRDSLRHLMTWRRGILDINAFLPKYRKKTRL